MQTTPLDIEGRLNASPTGQHLLLGEFVIPIGEDPTGETRGVSDGLVRGWIENGQLRVGVFSRDLNAWTRLGEERIKTIKLFSGTEAEVEVGWHLCDGTSGTPDLRDKFVLGGGWSDVGDSAGEQSTIIENHSETELESVMSNPTTTVEVQSGSGIVVASNTHDHDWQQIGVSHTTEQEHYPPYYQLAYIMKVS